MRSSPARGCAATTPSAAINTPMLRTPDFGLGLRTSHSRLRTPDSALRTSHSGLRTPAFSGLFPSEIRLRRRFVLERRDLVGIDANHQVGDVVVDLREPVAGAGRDHNHVAGLELMRHTVLNGLGVVARTIEHP